MINPKYRGFVKENSEILTEMFTERINQIKEAMIASEDEKTRERARELAIEFKGWLIDIGLIKKPRKIKKDSFV